MPSQAAGKKLMQRPRQVCWVMKNICKYSINLKNRQNERYDLQLYPTTHDDTHRADCLMYRCHHWGYVYRPVDRSYESQTARRGKDIDRLQENGCQGKEVLHTVLGVVLYRLTMLCRYPFPCLLHDLDGLLYILRIYFSKGKIVGKGGIEESRKNNECDHRE